LPSICFVAPPVESSAKLTARRGRHGLRRSAIPDQRTASDAAQQLPAARALRDLPAQPGAFTDSLTEILRSGARALLTQAVEAEVAEFLAKHSDLKTETGQQQVVRHGHLPVREIMTGIGPVAVRQPRVRDREATEGARIRYSPSILPRYARRSQSLEVLIPILYLKGISTGLFEEALAALVGKSLPLRRQGTRQVYRRRPSPASRACPRESGGGVDRGACALAEARSVS
jgi:hypothetical protein